MSVIERDEVRTRELVELSPVERGALLLDEHAPGWWRRIDLKTFQLTEPCLCVLGQIYGNYYDACADVFKWGENFATREKQTKRFGFSMESSRNEDWEPLQAEWVALIRARRENA